MTTPRSISEMSRPLPSAAGWNVPVAAEGVATTTRAASATTWTIRSSSWQGTAIGSRDRSGNYEMRFELSVPAGTEISSPRATLQFGQLAFFIQIRAGDGMAGSGWNTSRHDELFDEWGRFVYTHDTVITGPATLDLAFHLAGLTFPGSGTIGTITFTSDTPGDRSPIAFSVLRSNTSAGYITSPAG